MITATPTHGHSKGQSFAIDFAINRGEWFGKTWLILMHQGYMTATALVEADNEQDAIDILADSRAAHLINIDEADADEDTARAGNDGHPVNLEEVEIFRCKVNYFATQADYN